MIKIFIALFLSLSLSEAKTVMLIDTPVNTSHPMFANLDIVVYNYDKNYSSGKSYVDHGTGMLSIVVAGEGLRGKLEDKHKYVICSDFKNNNTSCYKLALSIGVDVINYSGGGQEEVVGELQYIKDLAKSGVVMFFAAGNEGKDIAKTSYYPASYAPSVSSITAVENVNAKGQRHESSSHSSYTVKHLGVNVMGARYNKSYGLYTGTSPATALATHKYLKSLEK